ncbi:hypothetical protein BRARA_A02540 [Brassica rapa]|uniref:Receptor-like serine/threonine-protein kinase n=1 Tax=Brassica campestris TaxID=3711 RepID=A0A398ASD4_BRACM|nr:hypothetical protein BRARA_A02540 [Brassica rapa]
MRFICWLLFAVLISFTYAAITPTSPLSIGQTLSSSNGAYELGFFSPNNTHNQYVGIWFKGIIPRVVVWVANREKPVTDCTANLTITGDGSLLLFNGKSGFVWSSGEVFASNGSHAELSDSGSLIVKDKVSGRTLWQSFDHLGDTLLHSSFLMYNLITGEKRVLTSWKTYTDPSPGDFVGEITPQVPSQGFIMRGSRPYWRSGPWAKTRFTGVPLMDESYTSTLSLHQDVNGSGYLSYFQRNYKLSRIVLTPEGSMKIFRYNGTNRELYYEAPLVNSCDVYGVCGPFGLCVSSVPPKCKCFKGFVPKSIEEWKRGNWTSGCVRRTELLCQGNSTERLLIYEFMLNKSLDTFIFDSRRKLEIEWPKRFSIIQGIARGLLYLHRESRLKVIHRDLKVSNILMDEKMNPKISDFGLARMYQGTEHEENTHRVAGTLGYMAPEYAWTGMFSEKSDIYSFGVLLLEIISGEKISRFGYGEEGKNLLTYAWETWGENGGTDLLDQGVAYSCRPLEVERCVHIGLLCVQHQPADRPNTLELLSMLTTTSDLPSPKQPTFVAQTRNEEFMAMGLTTVSKMTDSVILGR